MIRTTFLFCVVFSPLRDSYSQDYSWIPTNGPFGGTVYDLSFSTGGILLAGTSLGPVFSNDEGSLWNSNLGCPDSSTGSVCISSASTFFAGYTHRGLYRSTDGGISWARDVSDLGTSWIYSIESREEETIFVGTDDEAFRSTDNGDTWTSISVGLSPLVSVYSFQFVPSSDVVIAGTGTGLYRSTNNGDSWSRMDSLLITGAVFNLGRSLAGTFFAATTWNLYRSTDSGVNWSLDTIGLGGAEISGIATDSIGNIYAGATGSNRGIYRSANDGHSWVKLETDLPLYAGSVFDIIALPDDYLIIATSGGVYYSSDSGLSWVERNNGLMKISTRNVFGVQNGTVYSTTPFNGTYITSDLGNIWTRLEDEVFEYGGGYFTFAANNDGDIFVGTAGQILRSTDNGANWVILVGGLPTYTHITSFQFGAEHIIYAAGDYGIYKSTNNGTYWFEIATNLNISHAEIERTTYGTLIAATVADMYTYQLHTLYRSSDEGLTWTSINEGLGSGVYGPVIAAMTSSPEGDLLVAVTTPNASSKLFRSTNLGDNWILLPFDSTISISHTEFNADGDLFVAGDGVYTSSDDGITWLQVIDGLRHQEISSLAISVDGYAFVGSTTGVYRTLQTTTGVELTASTLPTVGTLHQNYPNPFNPSTTISFSIPTAGEVSLKVFSLLGEEVTTLASGEMVAGTHAIQWDDTGQPSGVYFYRLRAGGFTETRKLVLLR